MKDRLLAICLALFAALVVPVEALSATIWPATTIPGIVDSGPDNAVELGVRFRSDVGGTVTGIRFYKASTNTGTHVANLWSGSGTRLATATFSNETASGWQQVNFANPVAISANVFYVASYHTGSGHYSDDQYFFAASGVDSPPLHAPADGVSGYNGVYAYGSGSSYPDLGWRSSNYWVDVVFSPDAPQAPDTTPPLVPDGLAAAPYSTSQINLTWAASADPVISGQVTSGVAGYNVFRDLNVTPIATTTATTYSDSVLQPSTAYSYTVNAFDVAGNVSAQSAPISAATPPIDVTAPSVPGNLSAIAISSAQINLAWSSSSDNVGVAGYQIFRDGQPVATTATVFYADTGLIASTAYTYTLKAVDTSGNLSEFTSPVSATTTALAFADEFDGDTLDETKWVAMNRPGDSSNSELQYYLPANLSISNGWLNITGKADKSVPGYNYTSEMVQWKTFNFTYGTIEFRAKLAGGQGPWPAIWLLGSNCQQTNVISAENIAPCNWPEPGSDEINITEVMRGNLTTVNQQIHSGSYNAGCSASTEDVSLNWHDYKLVWEPGSLTWLIDGAPTCKITSGVPSTPMFLMVNIAMGGNGGGTIVDSTLPQTLSLDYLRVALYDTAAPAVPTGVSAAAVSASQINLSWNAGTDNIAVTGYKVFRGGVEIATVTSGTAFSNSGLTASTEYLYSVAAYDAAGNISAQSAVAAATTLAPDTTPPTVPAGLTATAVSDSQINLSWTASTDNVAVAGYKVFKGGMQVTSAVSGTTYISTGLTASTEYVYSVSAYDAAGNNSEPCSPVSAITLASDTTAPTVSITPSSGTVSGTITVSASVYDLVGVTRVEFYLDNVLQAADTAAPFSWSWNTTQASNGPHNLSARAYDAAGNAGTSSIAAVTVLNTAAGIVLVQKTSNTTSSAQNLAKALPLRVKAGSLIVVAVSGWPNLPAADAVTDTQKNTYAIAGTVLLSEGAYSAIYYAKNVRGGNNTVTVRTVKSGGQISMVVAEFSGVDTILPLDKTAGAIGSGTIPSSGTMTPDQAGELIIGSGTHNGSTITTAGEGFSMVAIAVEDSKTHQPLAMEYRVLDGTTPVSADFGLATGYPWTMNGALFKHK